MTPVSTRQPARRADPHLRRGRQPDHSPKSCSARATAASSPACWTQGTRAVSIGVDPVSGVSGLIWPGDHVDVILTQELENAPVATGCSSETILTNVRVIAHRPGDRPGRAASGSEVAGKLARTVTLQVDRDQAEKLAVAQAARQARPGDLRRQGRDEVPRSLTGRPRSGPTCPRRCRGPMAEPVGTTCTSSRARTARK